MGNSREDTTLPVGSQLVAYGRLKERREIVAWMRAYQEDTVAQFTAEARSQDGRPEGVTQEQYDFGIAQYGAALAGMLSQAIDALDQGAHVPPDDAFPLRDAQGEASVRLAGKDRRIDVADGKPKILDE